MRGPGAGLMSRPACPAFPEPVLRAQGPGKGQLPVYLHLPGLWPWGASLQRPPFSSNVCLSPAFPCLPLGRCALFWTGLYPPQHPQGGALTPPCDCVETGPPLPEPPSPALPAGCAHRVASFQPFVLPHLCTPCARGHHPSGLREAHQGPGSGLKVSSLSLWPLSTALSHQGFGHICVCLTTVCIPRRT